jgi:hypothetical protein
MNLPDSINQITTERQADSLVNMSKSLKPDIDSIIYFIKQKLPLEAVKQFDEGILCLKPAVSEATFLKGLFNQLSEVVTRSIKKSDIDDTYKKEIVDLYAVYFKSITNLYDSQVVLLSALNKYKKVIDVEEISYIILGYAIETIKKINNAREW